MGRSAQLLAIEPRVSIGEKEHVSTVVSEQVMRWIAGAGVAVVFVGILFWIRGTNPVPGNDVGGYVHMLRHFISTGRVDYMKWCQPTFIGVLPIAAPWALSFGTGMGSLSLMGIAYSTGLMAGLFLLISRHTSPLAAALLCSSLMCFADFLPCAATFMTDIPYAAYFVWFLLAHDLLFSRLGATTRQRTGLWILWAGSFILAGLTRPFIFVAVPVFFFQWLFASDGRRNFYRTCAAVSTALLLVSLIAVTALGENRFSLIEQTSIREVFVLKDYARFNVQAMLLAVLNTGLMALPALVLSTEIRRARLSAGDAFAGVAGLVVGIYYWRRDMFPCVLPLADPAAIKAVTLLQVFGASIGWVVAYRLLQESVRGTRGGSAPLLAAVIATQFAIMPIMQHPLLRHALPAVVALVALVAVYGIRLTRPAIAVAMVFIAAISLPNAIRARQAAQVEEAIWRVGGDLLGAGVPLQQLDGGWGWFCYYHLHPGAPDEEGYRARYYELRDHARYVVGIQPPKLGETLVIEEEVALAFGEPLTVIAVNRMDTRASAPVRRGGR